MRLALPQSATCVAAPAHLATRTPREELSCAPTAGRQLRLFVTIGWRRIDMQVGIDRSRSGTMYDQSELPPTIGVQASLLFCFSHSLLERIRR
jgi:hypothetical protein